MAAEKLRSAKRRGSISGARSAQLEHHEGSRLSAATPKPARMSGSVQPRWPACGERPDPGEQRDADQQRRRAGRCGRGPRRLDAAGHDVDHQQGEDAGRHVEEEDPLPRLEVDAGQRQPDVEQDPGPVGRADRHADEGGRALHAQRRGARAAAEQVAGQGHREWHQGAAAEPLDHPRGDQPVQAGLRAGQCARGRRPGCRCRRGSAPPRRAGARPTGRRRGRPAASPPRRPAGTRSRSTTPVPGPPSPRSRPRSMAARWPPPSARRRPGRHPARRPRARPTRRPGACAPTPRRSQVARPSVAALSTRPAAAIAIDMPADRSESAIGRDASPSPPSSASPAAGAGVAARSGAIPAAAGTRADATSSPVSSAAGIEGSSEPRKRPTVTAAAPAAQAASIGTASAAARPASRSPRQPSAMPAPRQAPGRAAGRLRRRRTSPARPPGEAPSG